ncbi:MAG: ABC transporter permease [Chloroflexi bacterium]|nr:MAG: ABC transporter permease [Chloroflexota bacterium]
MSTVFRRAGIFLYRFPGLRLALLLAPPLAWMVVVYLLALAFLFLTAFWRQDPVTSAIIQAWGFQNFQALWAVDVYRTIALRTAGMALAVTVTDVILAIPIAYYAARIASPRVRTFLLLSMVLPLWSSYLVRVYAWRVILSSDGLLNWSLHKLHLGSVNLGFSNWSLWIVFCYLWLPYVLLPIFAALQRIPNSLIEASTDLGARWFTTLRRVILPVALPGIVAGSIFAFSLTLGDYIAPNLVGDTEFIGNVIYQSVGIANNIPFAAAYAIVPAVIVAIYLLVARQLKAFEAL